MSSSDRLPRQTRTLNPWRTALAGAVVIWGLAWLSRPFIAARELGEQEIAPLQARLEQESREHEQLLAEERRLLSQTGMEEVIREQGYIKEGERRLVLREVPAAPAAAAARPEPAPPPTPGAVRLKQQTRAALERFKARIGRLFGR